MSARVENWGGELHGNAPLWRYMKLSTFLMLLEGKAFFPAVKMLQQSDPLECVCEENAQWLQQALSSDQTRYQDLRVSLDEWIERHGLGDVAPRRMYHYEEHYVEMLRQRRTVWCWHNSEAESAAMWAIYGERGIAVKTDVESLKAALPTGEFLISRIKYLKRDPGAPAFWWGWDRTEDPALVLRPYLIKSQEYAYEDEVRVVTHCPPRTDGWLIEDIDVLRLIKEVVVSPAIPRAEVQAMELSLRTRFEAVFPAGSGFREKFRRSILLGGQIDRDEMHAIAAQYFSNQPEKGPPNYFNEL